MFKPKFRSIMLAIFIIIFLLPPRTVSGEAEIFIDTQEKLDTITEAEKEVLGTLYSMEQDIQGLSREAEIVSNQIEVYKEEIQALEIEIQKEEDAYANNRDVLKEILQSYQRMGPGTFLEILLDSDSLITFMRRVNTLRDLTRNTGELMDTLDESKAKLAKEKEALLHKLSLLEEEQKQLQTILNSKMKLKDEKEIYLASLQEDRIYYEGFLKDITTAWEEIKPIFTEAAHEFSRLVEEGSLPPDALAVSFTALNIKGTIKEEAFNEVIMKNPQLPEMLFEFETGKIKLSVPKKSLVLFGNFIIEEVNTLKFVADEGSFYDMPLEKGSIEELFEEGYLVLMLKPLIGNSKIDTVQSNDGTLDLLINPDLF